MVIVNIIGGLGNQMFQYAAGKYISQKFNTTLKLDVNDFSGYDVWNFDLARLHTKFEMASSEEINQLKPETRFKKALQYLHPRQQRTYFREKYFHYAPSFQALGENVYLKGYFQSEKYFKPIENLIRQEFQIQPDLISNIQTLADGINRINSVAVHIRRGDYKNMAALKMHGMLETDYYREAISKMRKSNADVRFYFFSDDMAWVKENLREKNAVYVTGEITKTHFEDLYLMSQCRHNIIANSSFSWWGAWLNNNPDKIVIAPRNWFNEGPKDTYDLYPEGWIKI